MTPWRTYSMFVGLTLAATSAAAQPADSNVATPAASTEAPAVTEAAARSLQPPQAGSRQGAVELTWLGHAAWVLRSPQGTTVLIDPWLTNPRAPQSLNLPASVDAILVSHAHADHLGEATALSHKYAAPVVGSHELIEQLDLANGIGSNAGGTVRIKDLTIHLTEAVHSSGLSTPLPMFQAQAEPGAASMPTADALDAPAASQGEVKACCAEAKKAAVLPVAVAGKNEMPLKHGELPVGALPHACAHMAKKGAACCGHADCGSPNDSCKNKEGGCKHGQGGCKHGGSGCNHQEAGAESAEHGAHAEHGGQQAGPDGHGPKFVYGGAPVGFVIEVENGPTIYHAGDTDVFASMRLIARRYHPQVALLPIGGHYTMDPEGAALACHLLGVKEVLPMHYGTFPQLAGTPAALQRALSSEVRMVAPSPGARVSFPAP